LPLELALLPIVESAYDPFAYSHGRAAGLWQMIPGTARRFGVKQNWWYDGRRDVVDSTRAALDYLEYLYELNDGDWLNAIASYNSGEGNVLRSVKRNRKAGKPEDFWNLRLPRETSMYVPKLLALVDIVRNPERYNLTLPAVVDEPQFVVADIGSQLDLALAAELAGVDVDTVYTFNPGYNRWSTDPAGPHRLVLPVDVAEDFEMALAEVPEKERVRWLRHKVKHDPRGALPADPGRVQAAVRLQQERRREACEDTKPQACRQQGRARRPQRREFLDDQPAVRHHAPPAGRVERHGAGRHPARRPQTRDLDGQERRPAYVPDGGAGQHDAQASLHRSPGRFAVPDRESFPRIDQRHRALEQPGQEQDPAPRAEVDDVRGRYPAVELSRSFQLESPAGAGSYLEPINQGNSNGIYGRETGTDRRCRERPLHCHGYCRSLRARRRRTGVYLPE
jgi:hypothetical protein